MENWQSELLQKAVDLQASYAAWITTDLIPFAPELRDLCAQNSCGSYQTSWMGPPAIGPVEELMVKVRAFPGGMVVQTVGILEDSFDYPGMVAAKENHDAMFNRVVAAIRKQLPDTRILPLSVGCCHICGTCTYPDQPCCRPEEAFASVEAYGIHVNAMLTNCGLKYNNGPDTVSYVGLILMDKAQAS